MVELIRTETKAREEARAPHRLSVARMCRVLGVRRAEVYRHTAPRASAVADKEVCEAIKTVASEMPVYGYRRVVEEVSRRRGGNRVNHKRVRRVMHEENLVCRRRTRFRVTTDSRHGFAVYPNLAGEMKLAGINSVVGRRHHLCAVAERLLLSGGDPRCL